MASSYNPYMGNQFYMQDLQNMRDKIESQMRAMQQYQMQVPPQVTQNFQIAPQQTNTELESRYAENINDVKNTFVMKTGLFVNKDFSNLWVKDVSGNVKAYRLEEVIEMDDKDKEIYSLKKQIEEMRGEIANAKQYDSSNTNEQITNAKPTKLQNNKRGNVK